MSREIYWIEQVEWMVMSSANTDVKYFDNYEISLGTDFNMPTTHTESYIQTTLLANAENEFFKKIIDKSHIEIYRYIQKSFEQVTTRLPELIKPTLLENFWIELWIPNEPEGEPDKFHQDFFAFHFRAYQASFHVFAAFITKIKDDFSNGLLMPPQPQTHLQQLQPQSIPHKKLKVNITVPQLTFLFKMLNDLKPDIFDIETKKELSHFIADNFITEATKKDGIKEGSVYNLLTDTDKKTAMFWTEKLSKMIQEARQV